MSNFARPDMYHRLLCADHRFTLPDILNDHCWEIGNTHGQSPALAIETTYGLRASRMRLYPSFTFEEYLVQDPDHFAVKPIVKFSSTNFITLAFSPFQGIDVEYSLWVPGSQLLLGGITCQNNLDRLSTLEVTWQVQLTPLESGAPMKHEQVGLSSVLQGECANLFPVFYLPGEVYPARSVTPGLSAKYLLLPSATRQATWALASLSTPNASMQQARQFSSRTLDVEKLRIEMADKLDFVKILTSKTEFDHALEQSHTRAFQLLMPPLGRFRSPTFISSRRPDTGFHATSDRLDINPEWSGQTLPGIWMMAQALLPGQPQLVQGFLNNMLTSLKFNPRLDHRVGANGSQTGYPALPLLSQLVADLHPYLNDLNWLAEIHPLLVDFVKSWLIIEPDGHYSVRGLSHPVQMGESFSSPSDEIAASDAWMRWQEDDNLLATSLLIREISDLLQVSRWLEKKEEIAWLENVRTQLLNALLERWDEDRACFSHPRSTANHSAKGYLLRTYTHSGSYKPGRSLPVQGKIYLRITGEERLPSDSTCTITGECRGVPITLYIRSSDLLTIGSTRVYVSDQNLSRVQTVDIAHLPAGSTLEVGQPDYIQTDLTQLLALGIGVLSNKQVEKLLHKLHIRDFLSEDPNSLPPTAWSDSTYNVPAILPAMIVEGLMRYQKTALAEQVFNHFFTRRLLGRSEAQSITGGFNGLNLEELLPMRLFLKLRGIARLTGRELILTHFIKRKVDVVNVQYNKVELRLQPNLAEIHSQNGEVIYLNRPGPNRILLE